MSDARFVSPVERLLYLRKMPMFARLDPHELTILALYAEERTFSRGDRLLSEGEPVDAVIALVSGEIEAGRSRTFTRTFGPGSEVGGMALLSQDKRGIEAVARSSGVALTLAADPLYDIFEDHFSILEGALQATAAVLRHEQNALGRDAGVAPPQQVSMASHERHLDLVERMLVLRRAIPFAAAGITGLGELALRCHQVRYEPGEQLWEMGSPPEDMVLLVTGTVVCRSAHQEFRLGPGNVAGVIDLVARSPRDYEARTESRAVGLRIEHDAYIDTLEDHFELGVAALAALARMVLDVRERSAERASHRGTDLPEL